MTTLKKIFVILSAAVLFILYGCGLYYYKDSDEDRSKNTSADNNTTVKEVVDGDTIVLSDNNRVRLIGMNTPEQGMYFYEEAKEVLEAMVLDKEVILEKDISEVDIYGRLLRYVYVGDLFVNLEMVRRGFANIYTCPPDLKYTEEFLDAEREARLNEIGLWQETETCMVKIDLNYDADGNDNLNLNGEYAILKNTGTAPVDIRGWTVKDSGTSIYKFGSYIFQPDSFIYLFTGKGEDAGGKFYWGSYKPIWNNDHDTLYLRDKAGLLIEIYNY